MPGLFKAVIAAGFGLFNGDRFDKVFGNECALQKKIEVLHAIVSDIQDPKDKKSYLHLVKSLEATLVFVRSLRDLGGLGFSRLFGSNKRDTAEKYLKPIFMHLLLSYIHSYKNFEGDLDHCIHQAIKEFSDKMVDVFCIEIKKIDEFEKYFSLSDWAEWSYIKQLDVSTKVRKNYRNDMIVKKIFLAETAAFNQKISGFFDESNKPKLFDPNECNDFYSFFKVLWLSVIPKDNRNVKFILGFSDLVDVFVGVFIPKCPNDTAPLKSCLKESIAKVADVSNAFDKIKKPHVYNLMKNIKEVLERIGLVSQEDNNLFELTEVLPEKLSAKTQYFMNLKIKDFIIEYFVVKNDYKEFLKKFSWDTIVRLDSIYGNKFKKIPGYKKVALKKSLFEYIDAKLELDSGNVSYINVIPEEIFRQISKKYKEKIASIKLQTKESGELYDKEFLPFKLKMTKICDQWAEVYAKWEAAPESAEKTRLSVLNNSLADQYVVQEKENLLKIAELNSKHGFRFLAEYYNARSVLLKKAILKSKKANFQKNAIDCLGLQLSDFEDRSDCSFIDNLCANLFKKEDGGQATIKQLRKIDALFKANVSEVTLVKNKIRDILPQKKEIIDCLSKVLNFDLEKEVEMDVSNNINSIYDQYAKLYLSVDKFFNDSFRTKLDESVGSHEKEVETPENETDLDDVQIDVMPIDNEKFVSQPYNPVTEDDIKKICLIKTKVFAETSDVQKRGEKKGFIKIGVTAKGPDVLSSIFALIQKDFLDKLFRLNNFSEVVKNQITEKANFISLEIRKQHPNVFQLKNFIKLSKEFCARLNDACSEIYHLDVQFSEEKYKLDVQLSEEKYKQEPDQALKKSKALESSYGFKIDLYKALRTFVHTTPKSWFKRVLRKIKSFFSKVESAKMAQEKQDNALARDILNEIEYGNNKNQAPWIHEEQCALVFSQSTQKKLDSLKARVAIKDNALGALVKPSIECLERLSIK